MAKFRAFDPQQHIHGLSEAAKQICVSGNVKRKQTFKSAWNSSESSQRKQTCDPEPMKPMSQQNVEDKSDE